MSWFTRSALVGAAGVGATIAMAVPAGADGAADFVGGARYNGGRAIFIAKDLGGGAYWRSTTTAIAAAETTADAGETLLLTVNREVLVPVEDALEP